MLVQAGWIPYATSVWGRFTTSFTTASEAVAPSGGHPEVHQTRAKNSCEVWQAIDEGAERYASTSIAAVCWVAKNNPKELQWATEGKLHCEQREKYVLKLDRPWQVTAVLPEKTEFDADN